MLLRAAAQAQAGASSHDTCTFAHGIATVLPRPGPARTPRETEAPPRGHAPTADTAAHWHNGACARHQAFHDTRSTGTGPCAIVPLRYRSRGSPGTHEKTASLMHHASLVRRRGLPIHGRVFLLVKGVDKHLRGANS
eukprot:scaffold3166_cov399-Prasinococcus_capsulatus_cf.AAC.27